MTTSTPEDGFYEERSALYYPYIHIRSETWLKSALLAFQKVSRIVPSVYTLWDGDAIQRYSDICGLDGTPLLDRANSQTGRVRRAQDTLFIKLREHESILISRYSCGRTPEDFRVGEKAFQIHRMKLLDYRFTEWLVSSKLAWNVRGSGEDGSYEWLTMHPRLASAIMSVLALAIARQDGLSIVTPSQTTHETLLASTQEQVLSRLLDMPEFLEDEGAGRVSVQELCQVVLVTGFDLTRLTPEDIGEVIRKGSVELRKFYGGLTRFAANIPAGLDEPTRAKKLRSKAEEVLADWRQCMEKLPQLKEAVKEGASDKGLEKAVDLAREAGAAKSIAHFVGGLPGLALAVLVKAGSVMVRKRDTPYSFLNRVESIIDKRIGTLYVPQWRELAN
jgi:hypothetical protein